MSFVESLNQKPGSKQKATKESSQYIRTDDNGRPIRRSKNTKPEFENQNQFKEPVGALLSEPDEFMAAAIGDTAWLTQTLILKDKDGRDPNTLDKNGFAPIHLAALHGRLNCLQLLIDTYGIDVNLPSSTGWRPIHLAINSRIDKRSTQCLQYLIEKGADPSVMNEDNLTPAHQASIEGSIQCLNLLINAGACIDVKDSKGHTPLDYAKIWGHRNCARIISSQSWKQKKNEYFEEMEKLQTLKVLKDNEDKDREEGRIADKEFYGQLSFTNWLDNKGLPLKSTGPSHTELSPVPWSKQPRKYIEIHGDWSKTGHRGLARANSVAKDKHQPEMTELLKKLEQSHLKSEDLNRRTKKPDKKVKDTKKSQPHAATGGVDKDLKLPNEVIERELFKKPSPHVRGLTFKCQNIIDAQHKKLWAEYDKPLVEMYAHLSNSLDSSLFPKKQLSTPGSRQTLSTESDRQQESQRICNSIKKMSKPYRFPNITGEEYNYRFEIL